MMRNRILRVYPSDHRRGHRKAWVSAAWSGGVRWRV